MTDAHCHVSGGEQNVRELLIGRDFVGIHPWEAEDPSVADRLSAVREALLANPRAGVGEIGLDRLRQRELPPAMSRVFSAQLELADALRRPVVLHGAKCWGRVVAEVRRYPNIPSFLFHGFSRSDGLIDEIVKLNGYISVGPSVLNDHAVNYRELVKKIPLDRLLLETDRTVTNAADCPALSQVLATTAALRGIAASELERITDRNAGCFAVDIHADAVV